MKPIITSQHRADVGCDEDLHHQRKQRDASCDLGCDDDGHRPITVISASITNLLIPPITFII